LPHLPRDVNRIDVAMLDDEAMCELHEQYHRISDTTDVLTFDVSPSPDVPLEVDIAVGVEVAKRQAEARGHSIERELLLYIVHGLLHCMGYDDHDTASFAAMHEKEDRVLDAIGVGRTFTDGAGNHRPSSVGDVSNNRTPTADSRQPPSHKDHWG
jgi:probable rRNA maturation factor